ncbi:MAG TPA: hypothetical protein VLI06_21135 [Solimonas sp.]|nr:hypothetical protein [Solimonas sp.]
MRERRSEYDVTDTVHLADPRIVEQEVCRIIADLHPAADLAPVRHAFDTFTRLYAGVLPGFHGNDTWYHDALHSLDCTLAMARLVSGHERAVPAARRLGEKRLRLGVICALFHDAGYIRRTEETQYQNGAEFTLYHVRRSGDFLAEYLPTIGFGREAGLARELVHFTGYEVELDRIQVAHARDRMLGFMLGTADVLAQMADRCYLEKCLHFLYHEFKSCGLAGSPIPGGPQPIYTSPEELIRKTPEFSRKLFDERLDGYFGGVYRHMSDYFKGRNPYVEAIQEHIGFVRAVIESDNFSLLRRRPRAINAHVLRQILGIRLEQEHPREHLVLRRPRRGRPPPLLEPVDPASYVPT